MIIGRYMYLHWQEKALQFGMKTYAIKALLVWIRVLFGDWKPVQKSH